MRNTVNKLFISFFLKRNLFLTITLIFFGLTLLLYLFEKSSFSESAVKVYSADIQEKVNYEIQKSDEDLEKVLGQINKSNAFNFKDYKFPTNYPFVIYRNKEIIFWSDYKVVPDYNFLDRRNKIKALEWSGGTSLFNHKSLKNNTEVFSIINLKHFAETDSNTRKKIYNHSIFKLDPQEILVTHKKNSFVINSDRNEFLFSIIPPNAEILSKNTLPFYIIISGLICVLFLIAYLFAWIWFFNNSNRYELVFIILVSLVVIIRLTMLYYVIPFTFYQSNLFSPRFFNGSSLSPSLGDLMLNFLGLIIVLLYLTIFHYKMKVYLWLMNLRDSIKQVLSLFFLSITYFSVQFFYQKLIGLYEKSNNQLDISLSIDFWEKPLALFALSIFILTSLTYFLITHLSTSLVLKFNRNKTKNIYYYLLISLIAASIWVYLFYQFSFFVFVVHTVYLVVLVYTSFPSFLYTFRYKTSIYFFSAALVCASIGNYVIYSQLVKKDIYLKKQFGEKFFTENDEKAEYLLSQLTLEVKRDSSIFKGIKNQELAGELVQSQIKGSLLDNYFSLYTVDVLLFDAEGNSLNNDIEARDYQNYEDTFRGPKYRTKYENIYFVNDYKTDAEKEYFNFIPLENQENKIVGYIILDLKKPRAYTQATQPATSRLPMGDKMEARNFSFAVYDKGKIISTGGQGFSYQTKLSFISLNSRRILEDGIEENGYKHVATLSNKSNGKMIVVSSEALSLGTIYANFSFLFLILVINIILIVLVYAINYGFSITNMNITSKIQIYLNVSFLLPLILVLITTLGVIGTKFQESQEQTYLNQTESLSFNLIPTVEKFDRGEMSEEFLADTLSRILKNTQKNIWIFNKKGKLAATIKPFGTVSEVIPKQMNQEAFAKILVENESKGVFAETLNNLEFLTSYIQLKSSNGKVVGVASMPFYDAKAYYEKEVITVIGSLLNTFTTIFLGLLILSFFASNALLIPLHLITNKLRKIDLEKPSEPLYWKSDDEIGILVKAYNEMLVKLEESKAALADTNKQSAWQQMAKQVAHEIKNPLTPMKLSLQLLQRKLSQGSNIDVDQVKKQIESLTGQIDNLSYIANSFSDFARLPIPKSEKFDFVDEVCKVVNLFSEDTQIQINKYVPNRKIMVIGDRQLTGNIINNLLVNAIQAVPPGTKPAIEIGVEIGIEAVTFRIKDNGIGIPKESHGKIFMLDYSTKRGGSGVGLALAKWVVDNAKGSIWLESNENVGTTFFFTLPLDL